jgi:hypothetical protein
MKRTRAHAAPPVTAKRTFPRPWSSQLGQPNALEARNSHAPVSGCALPETGLHAPVRCSSVPYAAGRTAECSGRPSSVASPPAQIRANPAVPTSRRELLAAHNTYLRHWHNSPAAVVGGTPVGVLLTPPGRRDSRAPPRRAEPPRPAAPVPLERCAALLTNPRHLNPPDHESFLAAMLVRGEGLESSQSFCPALRSPNGAGNADSGVLGARIGVAMSSAPGHCLPPQVAGY